MSVIHFLNVRNADCNIIEHNSGRISVIDVCCTRKEIINEEWKKRPLIKKLKQTILHLFAPLM